MFLGVLRWSILFDTMVIFGGVLLCFFDTMLSYQCLGLSCQIIVNFGCGRVHVPNTGTVCLLGCGRVHVPNTSTVRGLGWHLG